MDSEEHVDFVQVTLVDSRGWVLMQERDEHAPAWPDMWCFPGGGLHAGEAPVDGAVRELAEETGVRLNPGDLSDLGRFELDTEERGTLRFHAFVARTALSQGDVECFEGRQMVFRDPADLPDLDLVRSTAIVAPHLDDWIRTHAAVTAKRPRPRVVMRVHPLPSMGAEDVAVAPDGTVYTGTADGAIWALDPATSSIRRIADTHGRPLGIETFGDDLIVCDAIRGVLRVAPATGAIDVLVGQVAGREMRFCNNAAVAPDGTIWFTDSSLHFGVDRWKDDFVQDTRTGRLIRRAPDGAVEVVLDGLAFANGVALAADESYVVVAECRARTLVRLWLTGPRAGQRDLLVADLPGYPDNISRGTDGLIWVALASPLDPLVERLGRAPVALRKVVTKIPEALQPKPARTIRAQAYAADGTLVHDLDLPEPANGPGFHMVTGVREHEGRLWLGSLHEPSVAVVDLR